MVKLVSFLRSMAEPIIRPGAAERARKLLASAEEGDHFDQCDLGDLYFYGRGVPQDYAEAAKWYRKSAEMGLSKAQDNLGYMYLMGYGVSQNHATAVRWFRKAADHDYASAQKNLGVMYYEGYGVSQDYVQAHMWFNLAASSSGGSHGFGGRRRDNQVQITEEQLAALGAFVSDWRSESEIKAANNISALGTKGRDMVAAKMTPAQIAEAQRLARKWKPTTGR